MDARRLRRVLVHLEGALAGNGSTLLVEDTSLDWRTGTLDLSVG
jgi:hypothetical protein